MAVGAVAGSAALVPWWWVGALGNPFDAVSAALAALAVGLLTARLCRLGVSRLAAGGRVGGLVLDALVATVALVLVGGSAGQPGAQLPLLAVFAVAGLAVAATDPARWAPAGVLLALLAFGPLGLVDADEVSLLLLPSDVPRWAAVAALASGLILLAGGVALAALAVRAVPADIVAEPDRATRPSRGAAGGRPRRPVASVVPPVLVAALVLVSAVVWLGPGQSGFHGERLFVVLDSQADLSQVPTTGDLTTRRRAVYRTLVEHARRTQGPLLEALRRVAGHPTSYYLVNAVSVDATPAVRAVLTGRDDVASVRPNPELRPLPVDEPPGKGTAPAPTSPPANIEQVRAPQAWAEGVDGRGVTVGFSDTGVDVGHPTLRSGFRGGDDSWHDPWHRTTTPIDYNGHGTHTAASAVGRTVGVAPGANWIGCVNLARDLGNPGYYLDCLQFMLAPYAPGEDPFTDGDPARSADVLNNSWGCPTIEGCAAGTLEPAVTALDAAGIFVVSAAGNSGSRCRSIVSPLARYDGVLTVGATEGDRSIADFSSRGPVPGDDGPKPDLSAPGVDVVSAWPGGGYAKLSGTSMASPQVAGVVALVWQAAPALRGDITRTAALLRATARPIASTDECAGSTRNVVGSGLVDAAAAVALARRTPTPPR